MSGYFDRLTRKVVVPSGALRPLVNTALSRARVSPQSEAEAGIEEFAFGSPARETEMETRKGEARLRGGEVSEPTRRVVSQPQASDGMPARVDVEADRAHRGASQGPGSVGLPEALPEHPANAAPRVAPTERRATAGHRAIPQAEEGVRADADRRQPTRERSVTSQVDGVGDESENAGSMQTGLMQTGLMQTGLTQTGLMQTDLMQATGVRAAFGMARQAAEAEPPRPEEPGPVVVSALRPAILGQRQRGADPAGVAATQRREPDEIHIHIGRIEVTAAMPATTQRAAAAPAVRKGPSLEEYLKRSGGQR